MNTSKQPSNQKDLARAALEAGCYAHEDGHVAKAARLFLKAAKLGSVEAQVNLGNILAAGTRSNAPDFDGARFWYRKAIEGGSPEAAWNLALKYRDRGNSRMHRFWLERAGRMGDEDAIEQLGARPTGTRNDHQRK